MEESEEWSQKWSQKPEAERPTCVTCGKPLWARGEQTRWLQTNGGEAVKLTRTYGTCPSVGLAFFLLDEELGLLSGGLTPRGEETLARLAMCERHLLQLIGIRNHDVSPSYVPPTDAQYSLLNM